MKGLKDETYRKEYRGYAITQTWKGMSLECSRIWKDNKHKIAFWGFDSTEQAKKWIDDRIAKKEDY